MQRIYKTLTGWKEEDEKHEATHVLMTESEYKANLDDARETARQEVLRKLEGRAKLAEEQFKKSAILKARELEEEYEQKKMQLFEEYQEEKSRLQAKEREIEINKQKAAAEVEEMKKEAKLICGGYERIMKERANAKREIKPKKQHEGYIVTRTTQAEYRWQLSYEEWKAETGLTDRRKYAADKIRKAPAWVTTIETPWDAGMDIATIQTIVKKERDKIFNNLGIVGKWKDEDKGTYPENDGRNIVFNWKFEANYVRGFWNFVIWTNHPVTVPEELRDPRSYA